MIATGALIGVSVHEAAADTLEGAIIQSYQNNPQLNAQRAAARVTDEGVSIALGGYRPRVTATGSIAQQHLDISSRVAIPGSAPLVTSGDGALKVYGITGTQTLFNGFQTGNRTRQAESQVFSARETLRNTEQAVLLSAVTAYMNLLRDAAILELQRSNVSVLEATLRQTRDRFSVGEVTRTDVAQSESRLAAGRSSMLAAESNYVTSKATYRQVIGVEAGKLTAGMPVDRFSPGTLSGALARATTEHPTITTATYNVDAAVFQVKIAEGALYPTVNLQGNIQKTLGSGTNFTTLSTGVASATVQLSVPIYAGGGEYATIRQAKETLGQRRLDLDNARKQVQATVTPAWGQLQAAQGADRRDHGAGCSRRDRAQRGTRGSPRRSAHHARRAQCPAGSGQRARRPRHCPTRPGGGFLYGAGGGRFAVAASPCTGHHDLRSDGALPSGARQLVRRAHAGWPLARSRRSCRAPRRRIRARRQSCR